MNLTDAVRKASSNNRSTILNRLYYAIYGLVLATSISLWFIAVRAPLWLDETGSYRQISAGFSGIWSRQNMFFPAYSYILWFSTKILGTSEIALRIPSILAMLGAVYLLYLAARELFERDIAFIAAIVFCLHPIVVFESIDVRPYTFATLATNAAILILVRLRRNSSNWLALLLGLSAACIVWFQYLFIAILPAIVLCLFVVKIGDRKALWRQAGVALAAFVLALLPVIPGLHYLFFTARAHVFELAPSPGDLLWTLAPGFLPLIFGMTALIAAVIARSDQQIHFQRWQILLCASLAILPILILYGVSAGTSLHMFTPRHRLVAIPGIALCWALILSPFRSRAVRLLFCVAFVSITAYPYYSSPSSREHSYTWKYALEVAEKSASADNAPVLICSDFPESNYEPMPLDSAKDSRLFAQLTYYKLSVPVVPLPRALNDEAVRVGSRFLHDAARKRERFLAVAVKPSYGTLNWLTQSAAATYSVRNLGEFDNIAVLEFVPRPGVVASR
jgi:4-amino-4-deoxy-L-arabinose transferase-like glycosyltransferase